MKWLANGYLRRGRVALIGAMNPDSAPSWFRTARCEELEGGSTVIARSELQMHV